MKLELPIKFTYEPMRGGGWEVRFEAPTQIYDYDEFVIDHFLRHDYS